MIHARASPTRATCINLKEEGIVQIIRKGEGMAKGRDQKKEKKKPKAPKAPK
jgi:hypothetical protein